MTRETRRSERNVFITSNDASIVARDARGAPRGVAQIDRNILRHVIGELTVLFLKNCSRGDCKRRNQRTRHAKSNGVRRRNFAEINRRWVTPAA